MYEPISRSEKLINVTKALERATDDLLLSLDPGIKKAVIALNFCDIKTYMSCEGHMGWGLPYPWIDCGTSSLQINCNENDNLSLQNKVSSLLKKFYSQREITLCALQIVQAQKNTFRLQSTNEIGHVGVIKTIVRDEVILSLLQKEMND